MPETATSPGARGRFVAAAHVVIRELREMGRAGRTYWLRTLCVAGPILALALMTWGQYSRQQTIDSLGRELFLTLAWTQLVLVCLIAPAATAGWMENERNNRTLEVLFTTPLSAGAILAGKSLSRLFEVLLLTISLLPVHFTLLLLGGVEATEVASVLLLTLAAGAFAGSFGVFISVFMPHNQRPVASVYMLLLALWFLAPMLLASTSGPGQMEPFWLIYFRFIELFNPFFCMIKHTQSSFPSEFWPPYATYIGLAGAGLLMVVLAALRLRHAALSRKKLSKNTAKQSAPNSQPVPTRDGAAAYLKSRAHGDPITGNPVGALAVQLAVPSRRMRKVRRVIFYVFAVGMIGQALKILIQLFLRDRGAWGDAWILYGAGYAVWFIVAISALTFSARVFVEERSRGALDILLTTTMRSSSIVWGKAWGFCRLYGPFLAVFIPCWFLPVFVAAIGKTHYYNRVNGEELFMMILSPFLVITTLASIVVWGMWVSMRTTTPTRAVLYALVGLAVWTVGLIILCAAILDGLNVYNDFTAFLLSLVLCGLPTVCAACLMSYNMVRRLRSAP